MPEERDYEELKAHVAKLEEQFIKLKEWSDLNDYWLREMINSLTESVDKLLNIEHEGEI